MTLSTVAVFAKRARPSGKPMATRSGTASAGCLLNDLLFSEWIGGMMAQALSCPDEYFGYAFARGIKLSSLQASDSVGAASAGSRQPFDHLDLRGLLILPMNCVVAFPAMWLCRPRGVWVAKTRPSRVSPHH
jgi:hypothetical protein